jgi:hypothetical protein
VSRSYLKPSGSSRGKGIRSGSIKRSNSYIVGRYRLDNIEVGDRVDVRDTEYIWLQGLVKIKIECANKEPLLVVHYEGWNKYYDEIIKQNSPRLAPRGIYSDRKDLPKYYLKSDNSMVGIIINRIQEQPKSFNSQTQTNIKKEDL